MTRDGYYWKLTVTGRKYDPNQPRVPAGNPRGGQWTAGAHADFVRLQRDIRESYPQPVRDAIAAKVREHYADRDIDEHSVDVYLDVMAMDEEKFRYYGEKIGLEDAGELWDRYKEEGGGLDRAMARQVAQMKDALAYKLRDREALDTQDLKWDKYYDEVEGAEAALAEKYGVRVERAVDVPDEVIRKHVSHLFKLAEANPALAAVMKDRVRTLRYEGRDDTAAAKWRDASHTLVVPYREGDWPVSPDVFTHELGHAAEGYVGGLEALDRMGFGQGRAASLYGAGNNPSEDWAEWFVGAFAQTPGLRAWDREKYDRVRELIDSLGGTGH